MFGIRRHGRAWPIGLDLGAEGIKMLQLAPAGGQLAVRAAARWSYPPTATDPAARREMAVAAVRALWRKGGFRGRRVNSALACGQQVHVKNIRVARMSPEELTEAVRWDAEERFPFPIHPERLRSFTAGEVRAGTETKDEVIVMAAPEEAIEEHMSLLDAMGLTADHIEVAPMALFRAYERYLRRQADEEVVSVIVDIGYGGTRVVVARGRQVVFIKDTDIGGRTLNQAVAKELNISEEEARDLRLQTMRSGASTRASDAQDGAPRPRDAMAWTVRDAVRREIEGMAKEISLCLRYCSVSFRGLHPERAILTGGETHDPAVREILAENLNVECQTGCPLRGIDTAAMAAADRRESLTEWSVCAGLALRDVDESHERTGRDGRDRLSA